MFQIQDLIKEKAFLALTSSKENLDFNFAKPFDFVALFDIRRA